mmetsp:Transcript_12272/g.25038  ORF Transcript_12272/g.25038 Transcript_12272/m.25038 type:complete len:201 (+) Transcript_12272:156-758(+)
MEASLVARTTPGRRIGSVEQYRPGQGVFVDLDDGSLRAALAGTVHIQFQDDHDSRPLVSVIRPHNLNLPHVLTVGDLVTARIIRITPRVATAEILCRGLTVLQGEQTFRATLRAQDVRATEIDKVKLFDSFRPNDIVQARVISLGDRFSYFISTAENELGVLFARCSTCSKPMVPVDWTSMRCPHQCNVEQRKVAKRPPQ